MQLHHFDVAANIPILHTLYTAQQGRRHEFEGGGQCIEQRL